MAGIQEIWDYLAVEDSEVAVLSVVFELGSDPPTLRSASLLFGPASIAETGWPGWRLSEGFKPTPGGSELEVSPTFVEDVGDVLVARVSMSVSAAREWLRDALEHGRSRASGGLPEGQVALDPARAPIRVTTHSQTPAGDLATWLARPVMGFHFQRKGDPADLPRPKSWNIEGHELFMPAVDLLGISWFDGKTGPEPSGLLVGRFERRAWLVSQRLDPDNDLYAVQLGIDPHHGDLADLEIEVEERLDDELIFAEHLRVEDTDIRDAVKALYGPVPEGQRLEIGIALPTLGRGMKRAVRLHHRDGALLDEWESFNIVESISFTLVIDGQQQRPSVSGERRAPQDLVGLLGGVERVRAQYAALRREGARNRIFDDAQEGRAALRSVLERARGELLVVDPFFKDWDLLEGLPGPGLRVLGGPKIAAPPAGFGGTARRWRGELPPFHDRFYLWEGGGVSVGTSAGTTRNRLYRIVRIGSAEVDELRTRFALWWADPGFEPV